MTTNLKHSFCAKVNTNTLWLISLTILCVLYFFNFLIPASLHDISHYMIAGVNYVRDYQDLFQPYAFNVKDSYNVFQDTNEILDTRTNYPNKLYSLLYGLIYLVTEKVRFEYAHWLSLAMLIINNILLFFIGNHLFKKFTLLCFLISANFLPVLQYNISPGSHIFGYFTVLLLLWLVICKKSHPFSIGLLSGMLFHFRAQSIILLFILPFISASIDKKYTSKKNISFYFIGSTLTYLMITLLYKSLISANIQTNAISFYTDYYANSFYSLEQLPVILSALTENVWDLFKTTYLFFLPILIGICIYISQQKLERNLSISSLIYISVPLCIYSLDSTFAPQAKYYIPAIPMILLAWFMTINNQKKLNQTIKRIITGVTALAILICFIITQATTSNSRLSWKPNDNLTFLDFNHVDKAIQQHFNAESLIISNHSLPTAFQRLNHVLYLPKFDLFRTGDNHSIDGIVFVYSDRAPNNTFKPVSWMVNGQLPNIIKDENGTLFKQAYHSISTLESNQTKDTAHFYIYKNVNINTHIKYDRQGNRIYVADNGIGLSHLRTHAPHFKQHAQWDGLSKPVMNNNGVSVGPGPSHKNIISQRFKVNANEKVKIVAVAKSTQTAQGRLQINWLSQDNQYLSTSLKVINVNNQEKTFSTTAIVPKKAKFGILYVTPHGETDIVEYKEMKVLGKKI